MNIIIKSSTTVTFMRGFFFKGIGTFRYFDNNLVSQVRIRNTKELGQLLININNEGKGGSAEISFERI
jgi:hypothetical protein